MQRDPKIARALEDYRRFQCLTQAKMAELLGTTQGHYSEVIGGQRELSKGAMQRAVTLGISANVLLSAGTGEHDRLKAQKEDILARERERNCQECPNRAALASAPEPEPVSPMAKMAQALRDKAAAEKASFDARVQSGEWGPVPEAWTEADCQPEHVAQVEGDAAVRILRWNKNVGAFDYPVGTKLYAASAALASAPAAEEWEKLRDPAVLHANLLRGIPAKLSREQLLHLAGQDSDVQAQVVETLPGAAAAAPSQDAAEIALRQVLDVVRRYLPPGGPSAHDAISEIIAVVDPWPLGRLEEKS